MFTAFLFKKFSLITIHYGLAVTDYVEILVETHVSPLASAALENVFGASLHYSDAAQIIAAASPDELDAFYETVRSFNSYVSGLRPVRYARAAVSAPTLDAILRIIDLVILIVLIYYVFVSLTASTFIGALRILNTYGFITENGFLVDGLMKTLFAVFVGTLSFNVALPVFYPSAGALTAAGVFLVAVLILLVAAIPFMLIGNWGAYATAYVKGQSTSANVVGEMLTDVVHLVSFFLRINIQLIRVVIIAGTSYSLYELYYEGIGDAYAAAAGLLNGAAWSNPLSTVVALLSAIMYMQFELGHFIVVAMMQSGAFGLIVLVITQFLYTAYVAARLQRYIADNRRH